MINVYSNCVCDGCLNTTTCYGMQNQDGADVVTLCKVCFPQENTNRTGTNSYADCRCDSCNKIATCYGMGFEDAEVVRLCNVCCPQ